MQRAESDKEFDEMVETYDSTAPERKRLLLKASLRNIWHKRNDNEVIQQNNNIKVSEANLAIEQLHEKLDRVSNKNMREINAMHNEFHGKSIMN